MRIVLAVLAIVAGLVGLCVAAYWLSSTANAEEVPCGKYRDLAAALLKNAGEQPMVISTVGHDATKLLVIFANPDTGTWTLVFSDVHEAACAVSSGENFTWNDYKKPKPGRPA